LAVDAINTIIRHFASAGDITRGRKQMTQYLQTHITSDTV